MAGPIDLDHLAVAVEHHRDAWPRYAGDLGGEWVSGGFGPGFAPAQVRYANGMKIEVLRPHRVEDNDFLRRFLDRSGPGPHHLTFKVDDLDEALARAREAGYEPVGVDRRDPEWQEAFLHPRDIPGVVVQLAQASGPPWETPRPADWPVARTSTPALLDYLAHAVADLDEGLALYTAVLGGQPSAEGSDEAGRWVDLAWPGPGRIRLLTPRSPRSPVAAWIGAGRGRIHHVAFTCERPSEVPGAVALADGSYDVPPEANLGVRLLLH